MAKQKKRRIPKKIGGVKVPKELRKTAEQVLDAAANPAVRQVAAAAAVAAGAALVAELQAKARRSAAETAEAEEPAAKAETTSGGDEVRELLRKAALEGAKRLLAR